jgi:hypothetical protein
LWDYLILQLVLRLTVIISFLEHRIKDREYGNVIINAEKDTDARAAAINEEIRRAERRRRAQMDSSSSAPSRFAPSMSSRFMEEDDR